MHKCTFEQDMKDIMNEEGISSDFSLLGGRKLPIGDTNGVIYWTILEYPEQGIMDDVDTKKQMEISMSHLQECMYPKIVRFTENATKAHIKILFTDNNNPDLPKKFERTTLARAYAWYGGKWQGYMFFNKDFLWGKKRHRRLDGKVIQNTAKVGTHEAIHNFGLGHSDDKSDIMRPINLPNNIINKGPDTQEGFEEIYGKVLNPIRDRAKVLIKKIFPTRSSLRRITKKQLVIICFLLGFGLEAKPLKESIIDQIWKQLNSQN